MQPCVAVVTVEWSLCMLMATITVCSLSSSPFTDNGRSVSHIVQHSNSQQDHAYRDRIAYRTTHHQSEGTLLHHSLTHHHSLPLSGSPSLNGSDPAPKLSVTSKHQPTMDLGFSDSSLDDEEDGEEGGE